jgi:hypothetical protein
MLLQSMVFALHAPLASAQQPSAAVSANPVGVPVVQGAVETDPTPDALVPTPVLRPHRFVRVAMYMPLHVVGKTAFSTPEGDSSLRTGLGRGLGFRVELAFRRVVSLGVMGEWTNELTLDAWQQREKPVDFTVVVAPWILIAHTFESIAGGLQLGVALHAGSTRWYADTELHRGPDIGAFLVARLFSGPSFAAFVETGVRHRRVSIEQASMRTTQLALHAGLLFGF